MTEESTTAATPKKPRNAPIDVKALKIEAGVELKAATPGPRGSAWDEVIDALKSGRLGSLGLDVIAEGVETTEHHQFLLSHGCRAFQGYLFGRPLALEDFERQVRQAA